MLWCFILHVTISKNVLKICKMLQNIFATVLACWTWTYAEVKIGGGYM